MRGEVFCIEPCRIIWDLSSVKGGVWVHQTDGLGRGLGDVRGRSRISCLAGFECVEG